MSHFIVIHAAGGLEGQPAGVEGDALADQREVGRRPGRGVARAAPAGAGGTDPWPTPRMPPYPPRGQGLLVEHGDRGAGAADGVARRLREGLAGTGRCGGALTRSRAPGHGVGDTAARCRRAPSGAVAGQRRHQEQRADGDGRVGGGAGAAARGRRRRRAGRPRRRRPRSSTSSAGSARTAEAVPARVRVAAPAARRSCSGPGAGSVPSGPAASGPVPVSTTTGARTPSPAGRRTTSSAAPVTPSAAARRAAPVQRRRQGVRPAAPAADPGGAHDEGAGLGTRGGAAAMTRSRVTASCCGRGHAGRSAGASGHARRWRCGRCSRSSPGRRARRGPDPLHDRHAASGARWRPSAAGRCRWSTRAAACSPSTARCASAVGVFDVSHLGKVAVAARAPRGSSTPR